MAEEDGVSILDSIVADRDELAAKADDKITLHLPGFKGKIAARYHRIDWAVLNGIVRMGQESPEDELNSSCDTLSKACDEILVRQGDKLVPVREAVEDIEAEVRYDASLAAWLKFDPNDAEGKPNARLIVRRLWGGNSYGDALMVAHQNEVYAWLSGAAVADEADFDERSATTGA